jgi:hypothetical protein
MPRRTPTAPHRQVLHIQEDVTTLAIRRTSCAGEVCSTRRVDQPRSGLGLVHEEVAGDVRNQPSAALALQVRRDNRLGLHSRAVADVRSARVPTTTDRGVRALHRRPEGSAIPLHRRRGPPFTDCWQLDMWTRSSAVALDQ